MAGDGKRTSRHGACLCSRVRQPLGARGERTVTRRRSSPSRVDRPRAWHCATAPRSTSSRSAWRRTIATRIAHRELRGSDVRTQTIVPKAGSAGLPSGPSPAAAVPAMCGSPDRAPHLRRCRCSPPSLARPSPRWSAPASCRAPSVRRTARNPAPWCSRRWASSPARACSRPRSARAILEQGGNAIDAAIAANAMMGLVAPMNDGIGGDLFAIVYDAQDRQAARPQCVGLGAEGAHRRLPARQGHHDACRRAASIRSRCPAR